MSTYGRNFEFRVPPVHGQRGARYSSPAAADVPIGAPVRVANGATPDALGRLPVALATAAQIPVKGLSGIAVFEHGPSAFAGSDAEMTTYSDKDLVPRSAGVQVVSGDMVKVVLRNTVNRTFMQSRSYTGRVMFAGTPAVGDFLSPGTGTDAAGYWAVNATAANAWLVVEKVDTARGEVECRMAF
jgi:hypothetical protein